MMRLVAALLERRDWTQADLAARLKTTQMSVSRWLKGSEPRGDKRDAIRALAAESGLIDLPDQQSTTIPIMGYIGAGAEIEPDYEQVPEDGIEQVAVPFPIGDDLIGFKIRGTSMAPLYEEDGIIIVQREQPWATDQMIGLNSAVRTHDGRRYLKRIATGGKPHTFNLESLDGRTRTIANARVAWASPVRLIIPNIGLRFIQRKAPARRAKPGGK